MSGAGGHDLSNIEVLASLSPEQRRDFEKSCQWRTFAAGEQIIDQQSDSRDVYFVTRGKVRMVTFAMSGREVALEDQGAGTYFGELAAIDGQPRSTSVVALETTDVARMAPERFIHLVKMYPDVAHTVMQHLAQVIRASVDRIVDLSTLGANNRVHGELLRQALAGKLDGDTSVISPIPVHSDMASRASTTRETVARVMNDLARQGLVKRERNSLIVNDVEKLREMVDKVRGF